MTKKIAISLADETLAKAKAAVKKGAAASVSGYIATLIERDDERETMEEMLDRWNREDGRTPAEIRAGRAKARADFERAGLIPKKKHRTKAA